MNGPVIVFENVSKAYRLGSIGRGTLTSDLQSWWAKKRNREDPNRIIGSQNVDMNSPFLALRDINFKVNKGDTLGIIGRNGAGKSTTLKLLSRVTAPSGGKIYIKGRVASLLEVGTGFHPELTGRENIFLNGAILGMTKNDIVDRIDEIIMFSECSRFIDTPVKRYSSGMYVKLAFSVASHLNNEILIMDEVLAVGDMEYQQKCLNRMMTLAHNENRTIIYVSHNMNTIQQLCNRCIVLSDGEIVYDGETNRAVQIYLERYICNVLFVDFTNKKRPEYLDYSHEYRMTYCRILRNTNGVFSDCDTMHFELGISALEEVNDLRLRIEYLSGNNAIGTSFCDAPFSLKIGNTRRSFSVDLSMLAPGRYETVFVLFRINSHLTSHDYDCMRSVVFEKQFAAKSLRNWNTKSWGCVILGKIEQ